MSRLKNFYSLGDHPWFARLYKGLPPFQKNMCVQFIRDNDHLDTNEFALAANRMFLDKEKIMYWEIINELVVVSNSIEVARAKRK